MLLRTEKRERRSGMIYLGSGIFMGPGNKLKNQKKKFFNLFNDTHEKIWYG